MAKHPWVVEAAVVEQKIRFPSERAFDEYLRKLDWDCEPYKVVSKENVKGDVVVVMRKRYCEYEFLGDTDPRRLSDVMLQIRDEVHGVSQDGVRTICAPTKDV